MRQIIINLHKKDMCLKCFKNYAHHHSIFIRADAQLAATAGKTHLYSCYYNMMGNVNDITQYYICVRVYECFRKEALILGPKTYKNLFILLLFWDFLIFNKVILSLNRIRYLY